MAIYSLALPSTVTTTGAAAWDAKAAATNEPAVMEIGVINGAATASTYGIGRSANTPTQTSPTLVQAEDEGRPPGLTGCAVAWSVAPTIPAAFFRRFLPPRAAAGHHCRRDDLDIPARHRARSRCGQPAAVEPCYKLCQHRGARRGG